MYPVHTKMADSIHDALSGFRDTILMSIARLEFQIRDTLSKRECCVESKRPRIHSDTMTEISEILPNTTFSERIAQSLQDIAIRMTDLEYQLQAVSSVKNQNACCLYNSSIENEIMKMEQPIHTRNILISSVRGTPALAAAVAAANPPSFNLSDMNQIYTLDQSSTTSDAEEVKVGVIDYDDEAEVEAEAEVEEDEAEVEEDEAEEDEAEVEEEDEEDEAMVEEADEEDEEAVEEEEVEVEIEVEEFTYKNIVYQRDKDNKVYLDGEEIGVWNGKKIIQSS
jgi:hypothetical protein